MICSLRSRLLMGMISGMVILLVIFNVIIYTVIQRALFNQFNDALVAAAGMLKATIEFDEDKIELEFDARMTEFQKGDNPAYYQFWDNDGTALLRSPSLGEDDLTCFNGPLDTLIFRELTLPDNQPGRAISLKFHPRVDYEKGEIEDNNENSGGARTAKQHTLTLVVARNTTDLHNQMFFLRWLLLIASLIIIILSFLIAVFVVRSGLSPLNLLAQKIATIKEDDLTNRIEAETLPKEIAPIKERLNELLSRLETSFNRERRFTADVAHELRTPLAGIRSTLEVTLTRDRNVDDYRSILNDCLAITKSMQTTVDNLLVLARLNARLVKFRHERIMVRELVDSCWQTYSEQAHRRGIAFENRLTVEIICLSDPENLVMVFSNLLGNAVEYTNEKGNIWITGDRIDGTIEITVANTGCSLTEEQAGQAFDLFWRGDPSRTDVCTHCGLGLALVQKIVTALGGRSSIAIQEGNIFSLKLVLPTGE